MENKVETNNRAISNIKVPKYSYLGFIYAEYTEVTNGPLPRLVVDFLCDADKIPNELRETSLEIFIEDKELRIDKVTVDDMKFNKNVVTLFFTVAPQDFYSVARTAKFRSVKDCAENLYFKNLDSIKGNSELDESLVEINQVGVTDYKLLNNILRANTSPSIFAYTLEGLNINTLGSISRESGGAEELLASEEDSSTERSSNEESKLTSKYKNIIDKKQPYQVDNDHEKDYSPEKLLKFNPRDTIAYTNPDNTLGTYLSDWGGIKYMYNKDLKFLIDNVVENTQYQKLNKLTFRITSQKDLGPIAGDIVTAKVPVLESKIYIVLERLIILGSEIKFNYKLKAITQSLKDNPELLI